MQIINIEIILYPMYQFLTNYTAQNNLFTLNQSVIYYSHFKLILLNKKNKVLFFGTVAFITAFSLPAQVNLSKVTAPDASAVF